MNCLAYQLKHVSHSSVIIPFATMTVADLPKSVRHEIDLTKSPTRLELRPGHKSAWMNDNEVLMDIRSNGYHIHGSAIRTG